MQLVYGNYSHDAAECVVQISRESLQDEAGRTYGRKERWTIQGFLIADTQAALTTAIQALERAYELNDQPVSLHLPDGTLSAHHLPATTKLGGTRVVSGPTFDEGKGAEYSTYRTYEIVLECTYPFSSTPANLVIAWAETLSFSGGGPRFLYMQPINGKPQKQRVADNTPYTVTQQGQAVGLYSYPVPAGPIWPAAEHRDRRQITRDHPKRDGQKYRDFKIGWSYQFEDASPLVGNPTLWRL